MPVRRDPRTGGWFFRTTVKLPDGTKRRLFGTPGIPGTYQDLPATKIGAQEGEQRAIKLELANAGVLAPVKKEVPTFAEWFKGPFWREWVIGRKNKPTEVRSKNIIYDLHLEPWFGSMRLDEITTPEVARFRAHLVALGTLGEKRINNILAVLSKPLKYAVDSEVLAKAPKIGMYKVERPEIVAWDFEQYARLVAAAKAEGEDWYAAVCLCGEAGLRVGEMKALRWREDVDMVARTITVNHQTRNKQTTTPKGRTRRTVPMTTTLYEALKRMSVVREGLVVRNLDGSAKRDGQADWVIARICRRAGLPVRYWHVLRHSFGTHAALFGVNPWRLQTWMGHKRIDETMLYVHVAEAHARELPEIVRATGDGIADADKRVIAMLGARGSHVAAKPAAENDLSGISAA
jgi:integrase